jgi:GTP cyclohydrolase IIa
MDTKQLQVTLIQLDNYGPWTETLGSDREHKLQVLQADLYSAIQGSFAERDGLVFFNRFDEMLAVSNGLTLEDHQKIRDRVQQEFPITLSMAIGVAETPYQAQLRASKLLQEKGSAQSPTRKSFIVHQGILDLANSHVQIAHFDIDGITQTLTDCASAYDTSLHVMTLYAKLMWSFREREALLFYLGGDNFMSVANGVSIEQIDSLLDHYHSRNIRLKCGIGIARTARKAAELAAMKLDVIRRNMNEARALLSATSLRPET